MQHFSVQQLIMVLFVAWNWMSAQDCCKYGTRFNKVSLKTAVKKETVNCRSGVNRRAAESVRFCFTTTHQYPSVEPTTWWQYSHSLTLWRKIRATCEAFELCTEKSTEWIQCRIRVELYVGSIFKTRTLSLQIRKGLGFKHSKCHVKQANKFQTATIL